MITEAQRQDAIASLTSSAAYQLLLAEVELSMDGLVQAMTTAKTDAEFLRVGRLWQTAYSFFVILRDTPQHCRERIEDIQREARESGDNAYNDALPLERAAALREIEQAVKTHPVKKRSQ